MRKKFGLVEFITVFLVLGAFSCLILPYLPVVSPKLEASYIPSLSIKIKWIFFEKPEVQKLKDHLLSGLEKYRSEYGKDVIPPSLDVFKLPPKGKRFSPFVVEYPLSIVRAHLYQDKPHLSIEVGPYRKTRQHWYSGTEGYEIIIPLVGDSSPYCLGLYNACHNRFKCLNPHEPKNGWLDMCFLGDRL